MYSGMYFNLSRASLSFLILLAPMTPNYANILTDVGLGPVPPFDPNQGTVWTLSSSCIDINESGEAACQTQAVGPVYGCGWRNAQSCSSKVKLVHKWDGFVLVQMSAADAEYDVPLVMNNNGEIGGYAYVGEVYPSAGENGRIWSVPGFPVTKNSVVRSLNDSGDYVLQWFDNPGGISHYTSTAYRADGAEIVYPGNFVRPFVIGNNDDLIGAQILQDFVHDIHSPTGNEIPEVSGVGWLLTEQQLADLPTNPDGLYDIDGDVLWPSTFYRPMGFTDYETTVSDVNDVGEFVVQTRFGGLFNARFCSPIGESEVTDIYGGVQTVPWVCESSNYHGGTYAGGKAFRGINNIGDAVGVFTPGAYSYQTSYTTHPWVWLRNARNKWEEFNANDLLPVDSGYSVLTVKDINDSRQIVGSCRNNATEVVTGCILDLTDHPVPLSIARPSITIKNPAIGDTVSGVVSIDATAWDRDGSIRKVVFKVGSQRLGVVKKAPYRMSWDTAQSVPGQHTIKAIAVDDQGNKTAARIQVIIADQPVPGGDEVEGEGIITAVGSGYIEIDSIVTWYDNNTLLTFNEVTGFEVGLSVQYKGILAADGTVMATALEVN